MDDQLAWLCEVLRNLILQFIYNQLVYDLCEHLQYN